MISNCQKYLAIRLTFICVIVLYRSLGDRQFRMHGLGRNSSARPTPFGRWLSALPKCPQHLPFALLAEEKAPPRDHSQDGAFLLWIRANTLRRNRR